MKRFKQYLIEGANDVEVKRDPLPTTYRSIMHQAYGPRADDLIADAQRAQEAAKGTKDDISQSVNLPNYKFADSPIAVYRRTEKTKEGKDNPPPVNTAGGLIGGQALQRTTDDPDATAKMYIFRTKDDPNQPGQVDLTKAHEGVHTLQRKQPDSTFPKRQDTPSNETYMSPNEIPAYVSEFERAVFKGTGKVLDSSTTEEDRQKALDYAEKEGLLPPELLYQMRDPKKAQFFLNVHKQVAKKDQGGSSVRDTSGGMAQA